MSRHLRVILGDQLSTQLEIIREANRETDVILMAEVMDEGTYVPHHPKKIAFVLSAMRHFAEALTVAGFNVRYVRLDEAGNTQSLAGEVERALDLFKPVRVLITEPGEWRLKQAFDELARRLSVPLDILSDTRFLCSHVEFDTWAEGRKQWRMEYFYRYMRNKYHVLMEPDGTPVGGQWNYDAENRSPPGLGLKSPARLSHKKDQTTLGVLKLVAELFGDHFGALEPFHMAVTRKQALKEARHFIDQLLTDFGTYQDAMVSGEAYLYHSLLAAYLNAGLLYPLELIRMAEAAYHAKAVPLNAAEGFIRQILGWREYVRGLYWQHMPGYADLNLLEATAPLPELYWGGPTRMACLREVVAQTHTHAYSHHIQRLMITGNFALLSGIDPKAVHHWYLAVYADAYEWVELPNTLGMALHADGGILASKPYAASGNYINKMSNFCGQCAYNPKQTVGDAACPFNALYWDFMARHEARFKANPRLGFVFGNWAKMGLQKQSDIRAQAARHMVALARGDL